MSEPKNLHTISMQKIALGVVFCIFVCCLSLGGWYYSYLQQPLPKGDHETVLVHIPRGSSFAKIQSILVEKGLMADDIRFAIMAKLTKKSHLVQAGEFEIQYGQKPEALLTELISAKPVHYVLTIPEGLHLDEIGVIIASRGWGTKKEFEHALQDPELLKSLGLTAHQSLEGYLFPDTYHLTRDDISAANIVKMMVKRFQKVYSSLQAPAGTNMHELVTLASMVEEEAVRASEQARIAGVFTNRLRIGMRLQSDPTVVYGVEGHNGPIKRSDLRRETPYNTYVIKGLPPGPIANPGRGALQAALAPEMHKFLYFVADATGGHVFTTNLRDHNRAVSEYRKKIKNKA